MSNPKKNAVLEVIYNHMNDPLDWSGSIAIPIGEFPDGRSESSVLTLQELESDGIITQGGHNLSEYKVNIKDHDFFRNRGWLTQGSSMYHDPMSMNLDLNSFNTNIQINNNTIGDGNTISESMKQEDIGSNHATKRGLLEWASALFAAIGRIFGWV